MHGAGKPRHHQAHPQAQSGHGCHAAEDVRGGGERLGEAQAVHVVQKLRSLCHVVHIVRNYVVHVHYKLCVVEMYP